MSRYVKADTAIKAFYEMASDTDHIYTISDGIKFLESMSDAIEIVRCKDCIYSQDIRACNLPYGAYGFDGYCPLGKEFDDGEIH